MLASGDRLSTSDRWLLIKRKKNEKEKRKMIDFNRRHTEDISCGTSLPGGDQRDSIWNANIFFLSFGTESCCACREARTNSNEPKRVINRTTLRFVINVERRVVLERTKRQKHFVCTLPLPHCSCPFILRSWTDRSVIINGREILLYIYII